MCIRDSYEPLPGWDHWRAASGEFCCRLPSLAQSCGVCQCPRRDFARFRLWSRTCSPRVRVLDTELLHRHRYRRPSTNRGHPKEKAALDGSLRRKKADRWPTVRADRPRAQPTDRADGPTPTDRGRLEFCNRALRRACMELIRRLREDNVGACSSCLTITTYFWAGGE